MTPEKKNRLAVFVFALVAGVVASVVVMLVTHRPLYAAIFSGFTSFAGILIGSRLEREYRASLTARAEKIEPATDAEITWEVRMNDVIAGNISDRELADIQGGVASDWHVWLSQLVNLFGVPIAMLDKLVLVVPAVAFWLIFALALLDPSSLIHTLTAISNASPGEIQHGMTNVLTALLMLGIMFVALTWIFQGYTFGLRNVANDEFSYRLRRRLKITAMGELHIARIADGRYSRYSPDMLGWLRSRIASRRAARNTARAKH
ncbi:hypothetical protein [Ralstonia thomasii]|uniref:Uncharacterized protein n=1 Tax=Ralstonia thomasii TaxID=3058596 RepID=A0ABN9JEH5_9RALS|nr:hypothetical protein [Ralstonia sp. LMG 18095]CAJ0806867.1 hypothetical protein LMG18095_04514 [Ralstonia sp. LMG 18095]